MPTLWFVLVAGMLTTYAVLDGFDLGAGIIHWFVARTDDERQIVLRTIFGMSIHALVVTSPATMAMPVFTSVSTAMRARGSFWISASTTPSEIWSQILSGWPSVTDSEVKRKSFGMAVSFVGGW